MTTIYQNYTFIQVSFTVMYYMIKNVYEFGRAVKNRKIMHWNIIFRNNKYREDILRNDNKQESYYQEIYCTENHNREVKKWEHNS